MVPIGAAGAASDASGRVSAESQGWWNVAAAAVAVPATPLGGLAPVPTAPAPDVPDGVLPVSMRLGQAERVAAIGMRLDAPTGTEVKRLVLVLKESTASLAQQGSGAGVRACPVKDFFVPESNGQAANAPVEDCDLAHADGVRGADGSWTFDLTSIAQAWASGTVSANGVRFDPIGTAPATFQVGFTGYQDAVIEADLVAGAAAADPFATPTGSDAFSPSGSVDSSSGSLGGDLGVAPAPVAVATPPTVAATVRPTVPIVAHGPSSGFIGSMLATLVLFIAIGMLGVATMLRLGAPAAALAAPGPPSRRVSAVLSRRMSTGDRRA